MEELLLLGTENSMDEEGKPRDKEYLETGLPESLQHALDEYIQGKKVPYFDFNTFEYCNEIIIVVKPTFNGLKGECILKVEV